MELLADTIELLVNVTRVTDSVVLMIVLAGILVCPSVIVDDVPFIVDMPDEDTGTEVGEVLVGADDPVKEVRDSLAEFNSEETRAVSNLLKLMNQKISQIT